MSGPHRIEPADPAALQAADAALHGYPAPGVSAKTGLPAPSKQWTLREADIVTHPSDGRRAYPISDSTADALADPVQRARCTPAQLALLDAANAAKMPLPPDWTPTLPRYP